MRPLINTYFTYKMVLKIARDIDVFLVQPFLMQFNKKYL